MKICMTSALHPWRGFTCRWEPLCFWIARLQAALLSCVDLDTGTQDVCGQHWDHTVQGADSGMIDLIQRCLQWDPASRITASQALQHPWITTIGQQMRKH